MWTSWPSILGNSAAGVVVAAVLLKLVTIQLNRQPLQTVKQWDACQVRPRLYISNFPSAMNREELRKR